MTIKNPYLIPDDAKLVKQRVSWTAEGLALSDEEKEKIIAESRARANEARADVVVIPRSQMEDIAKALRELVKLGQSSIEEWTTMPKEVANLKSTIFGLAEFPSMFASQCLELNKKE